MRTSIFLFLGIFGLFSCSQPQSPTIFTGSDNKPTKIDMSDVRDIFIGKDSGINRSSTSSQNALFVIRTGGTIGRAKVTNQAGAEVQSLIPKSLYRVGKYIGLEFSNVDFKIALDPTTGTAYDVSSYNIKWSVYLSGQIYTNSSYTNVSNSVIGQLMRLDLPNRLATPLSNNSQNPVLGVDGTGGVLVGLKNQDYGIDYGTSPSIEPALSALNQYRYFPNDGSLPYDLTNGPLQGVNTTIIGDGVGLYYENIQFQPFIGKDLNGYFLLTYQTTDYNSPAPRSTIQHGELWSISFGKESAAYTKLLELSRSYIVPDLRTSVVYRGGSKDILEGWDNAYLKVVKNADGTFSETSTASELVINPYYYSGSRYHIWQSNGHFYRQDTVLESPPSQIQDPSFSLTNSTWWQVGNTIQLSKQVSATSILNYQFDDSQGWHLISTLTAEPVQILTIE